MRFLKFVTLSVLLAMPGLAQQDTRYRNFYPSPATAYQSTTTSSATTGASASFLNPTYGTPTPTFCVQMILVGGTSATGRVEGSIDNVNFFSLNASDFSLTAGQNTGLTFSTPWRYLRFNMLTNVGGGTAIALICW